MATTRPKQLLSIRPPSERMAGTWPLQNDRGSGDAAGEGLGGQMDHCLRYFTVLLRRNHTEPAFRMWDAVVSVLLTSLGRVNAAPRRRCLRVRPAGFLKYLPDSSFPLRPGLDHGGQRQRPSGGSGKNQYRYRDSHTLPDGGAKQTQGSYRWLHACYCPVQLITKF